MLYQRSHLNHDSNALRCFDLLYSCYAAPIDFSDSHDKLTHA